jgi:hypothetical protein
VRGDPLRATDPVEDAIRASRLEVVLTADVPAPIELAGEAALADSLARAGIVADPIAPPGPTSAAEAAAPYRRGDGTYRFENRLRFWVLGSLQ